jgi:NhaP-type Na+/H+ or K+/H+ antiporter
MNLRIVKRTFFPYYEVMTFEWIFFLVFFGGWGFATLFKSIGFPPLIGMILWGGLLTLGLDRFGFSLPLGFTETEPFLKSLALVIILLRAGLGLSRKELVKIGRPAILMAFLPALLEGFLVMGLLMVWMDFPWPVAGFTGFMIAAVSPAVVVPSMLELQEKGKGKSSGVVTMILAGASVDDVVAITLFTVFLGLATGGEVADQGVVSQLLFVPVSLAGGIGIGTLVGSMLAKWFRHAHNRIRATEKAVVAIAISVLLVQLGTLTGLAALLGVMTIGFMIVELANPTGQELASKLGKIWVVAQLYLFVVIGMALDLGALLGLGLPVIGILAIGLIARSVGVWISTAGAGFSNIERIFSMCAYLPKATVQAALGGIALSRGLPQGQSILALAVLAIVITAPLGLVGIRITSKYLDS